MPSIITHAVVAAALAPALVPRERRAAVVLAGMACAVLPDADSLGFAYGIRYDSMVGHRGITHSVAFAVLAAAGVTWLAARRWSLREHAARLAAYFFLCSVSHGLLDACTDGGRGIAFLAPFSPHRFFFPWRPIVVSPVSITRFLAGRGADVLRSEMRWVWLPAAAVAMVGLTVRWAVVRSRRPRG